MIRLPCTRAFLAWAALLLVPCLPAVARSQGPPGDTQPPTIFFTPTGSTVYSASKTVTIGFCDDKTLASGTRQVKLNGSAISTTWVAGTQVSCGAYGTVTVALTLPPGADTLWAQVCDGSGNCTSNSTIYTYDTSPDVSPPTVQISPATQTTSLSSLPVTLTWCEERALGTGRNVSLNGTDITSSFTYTSQSATTSCNVRATSTYTIPISPGANTLVAAIQDTAGNWGSQTVTYTYRPSIDTSPTNQFSTGPGMFDATLSYSTPAYRSLDTDRAVTLVYSSSQARPAVMVQMDVTDNSSQPADTMSLGLLWHGSWQVRPDGVQTDINYRTVAGTNRLTTFYGASNTATQAMAMQAVVKRFWTGGNATDTVPLRILVVNEKDSPYGAGWTVAGVERIVNGTTQDPGIMVLHGDATATFYPAYSSCSGVTNLCHYGHTPGNFGTMTWNTSTNQWVRTAVNGTKSTFNAAGQLVEVRDRLNNVQSYAYSSGRLDSIMDPAGKVTRFAYNGSGKLSTITDPTGRVTTFVVNASGDLTSITDPDGVTALAMTYQSTHRMLTYVDRATRTWTFTYDAFGKLATAVSPSFVAETGSSFQLTNTFTSMGMAAQGQVNGGTHTSPLPRVNPATLRVSVVDPMSRTTRFALDPWGAPSLVEDHVGYVSTTARNAEGQVVSTVDPKGNTTSYTWNAGNLTRVSSPTSGTVNATYNTYGQPEIISGSTAYTLNHYNSTTGVLDSTVVSNTDTTRFTYDTRGRVLTVTDPEHHVTTYDYTDLSPWMNTRSVTSGGRTTYYRYDGVGRVLGVTAPDGRETTFQYDSINRQRYVTRPDSGTTQYVWGRIFLDQVTDPRGLSYSWTRNAMGWVTSESRPGDTTGVHLTSVYDRYGRPTSVTNRRGQTVSVVYDTQDRVTSRTADGQTTTFAFSTDQPTNPTAPTWVAVSNPESTDTVRLDGNARLTSAWSRRTLSGVPAQTYELQPRYDGMSRPVGLVVLQPGPVRDSIGYYYDPTTLRLQKLRDMAGGTTIFEYTREGIPWRTTLPNSQQISQGFTSLHQPSSIRYGATAIDNMAGVEYEYDALGRIQSWIRPNYGRAREYTYSPNGRWLSAYADYVQSGSSHPTCTLDANYGRVCTDPSAVMTYTGGDSFTYDLGGNPTNHSASVGAGNRLATYDGYTLGYDLDGNLTSKTKSGFSQTFAWNSLGQLTSVTTNGTTVSYGYDGMGKRVRRTVSGVDTGYLYDTDGNLLVEYDGNGVQAKYTYYPGEDRAHSMRRGGQTYYYATDVQGSVLGLFNSSNSVVNEYRYLPFGESQYANETVTNPIRYAGRELDPSSGLTYNNARWYDPSLHRFVSEDPIGISGGLNLYAYTGNDPVNFTDPSGLIMRCIDVTRLVHVYIPATANERATSKLFRVTERICWDEKASQEAQRRAVVVSSHREEVRAPSMAAAQREWAAQEAEDQFREQCNAASNRAALAVAADGVFYISLAQVWAIRATAAGFNAAVRSGEHTVEQLIRWPGAPQVAEATKGWSFGAATGWGIGLGTTASENRPFWQSLPGPNAWNAWIEAKRVCIDREYSVAR